MFSGGAYAAAIHERPEFPADRIIIHRVYPCIDNEI